jgi:genome maintenance exonuclease 1
MDNGSRNYDIAGYRLPSVTTILGKTHPPEKAKKLAEWRARKGDKEADKIMNMSSVRGTSMHRYLEYYLEGKGYEDMTEFGQQAKSMARKVIDVGMAPVDEYYGSEVTLYYPGLYAGATDLVCRHNNKETIVDLPLPSYIEQCVIMICTPDLYYQEFKIDGLNLRKAKHDFLKRLDEYYEQDEKEVNLYGA